jgi:hypothetical protein
MERNSALHLFGTKNVFYAVTFKWLMARPVSEFMSQKLDLITLHGMVKEGGGNGGSP